MRTRRSPRNQERLWRQIGRDLARAAQPPSPERTTMPTKPRGPRNQERLWRQIGRNLARAAQPPSPERTTMPTKPRGDALIAKIQRDSYFEPLRHPINSHDEMDRAMREAITADVLAEAAHMRLMDIKHVCSAAPGQFSLTPEQAEAMIKRLDQIASSLEASRESLGDAAYHLERLVK